MKLIIDIPDHLYTVIKNKECTHRNVLTEAIYYGIPLDDLRAEINAIEMNGQIDEHTLFARSADGVKDMVLEIIDRYRGNANDKA